MTRKGALIELAIVTAGVLIALSVDGVRGWMAERALVADARANLASELRDNKAAVDRFRQTIPTRRNELDTIGSIATTRLQGKPSPSGEAALGFTLADVTAASRSTAEITGAFGLMDYAEVKDYASVYDLQRRFSELQEDTMTLLRSVLSRIDLIEAPKPSVAELEAWLRDIHTLEAQLLFLDQIGEQLSTGYGTVIERARQD